MRNVTKQILLSSNYWVLNKDVVYTFGIEAALMLSVLAEAENILSDKEGWFYQTIETLEKQSTLTRHRQDKAIKTLIDDGILLQDNRGVPMKRYFKINYEKLTETLINVSLRNSDKLGCENSTNYFVKNQQTRLQNSDKLDCKNSTTSKESNKENNNKENNKDIYTPYQEIVDLYNDTCKSLPKIIKVTSKRKRDIKKIYELFDKDIDVIAKAFTLAEESDFLSGRNGKWGSCNFDWIMKENNFIKILEETYSNSQKGANRDGNDKYRTGDNENKEEGPELPSWIFGE